MNNRLYFLFFMFFLPLAGIGQQQAGTNHFQPDSTERSRIFELGEIIIMAPGPIRTVNKINESAMNANNRLDVSRALNMLAGIHLTASGARNESMVAVRGFDLRQVPVYMDGIPVYVPFDGYADLARFTTFDLSAIDVSKGFSSVLYGPNSMGGAINLISRVPAEKFEFDGSAGLINGNGFRGNVNMGSNQGKFYVQGGYAYLHRDAYRMSARFAPAKHEDGKERDNSYRTDQKLHLKIGWTPNEKGEYVLGFIKQKGSKGTPVYTGTDTLNSLHRKPRFWQWPSWDKTTCYFISKTNLPGKHYLKSRIYFDEFKNSLFSYDDNTYSSMTKPSAFKTWYNDYTYGGSIEYGTTTFNKHNLKIALHYKRDVHRQNDWDEPVIHFADHTVTLGAEDIYSISERWVVIPGISFSTRKNTVAEEYNSSTNTISSFDGAKGSNAFNGQVGFYHLLNNHQKAGISFSRKTRFATIKDRYSYRMGTAIPNPGLRPESANNYELNYAGVFFKTVSVQAALFYSHISDIIMNISNAEPGKSQMQNTGKAEYMGAEVSLGYQMTKKASAGINYTYIRRKNITNPEIYFTDIPNSKLFGYVYWYPFKGMQITPGAEYNSARYSTSYGTQVGGFTLLNIGVTQQVLKHFALEAGLNNIFDKNYSLVEGFPEEGRNFYVTLRFFNH